MPKFAGIKVSLTLPYIGGIEGTWVPDEDEKRAAWEMYVELVTRVSVAELGPDEGLVREALSSLYSLFDTTRKILRNYGPSVARPKGEGQLSFGYLAVAILNTVLRPTLAHWHPQLQDYENLRQASISPRQHEQNWEQIDQIRQELNDVRATLTAYADILAQVAGVPSLIIERPN